MAIAEQPITLEQFLALPEAEPALEYFGGRVTQKVSPKFRHGVIQGQIIRLSNNILVPSQGGLAASEVRVTIGGASRVPDVLIFRRGRIPCDADGELLDDVTTAPDVIVEVLSPGQTQREQRDRCHWFVSQGVQAALLVHPRERWIDVIRAGQPVIRLKSGDTLDLSAVIPDLILAVTEIFALVSI
jgi:Uma2 family endonuclease